MKCAVVTPVGPGHQQRYDDCAASIRFAWEQDHGPFETIELLPQWDLDGAAGRSAKRNDGIAAAQQIGADWIFFLDADDLMYPWAFRNFAKHADGHDAVWGNICEMMAGSSNFGLRRNQLVATSDIADILTTDPFLTLQMGHFVRTDCAAAIGFDTAMDTGEDFQYYLGLWQRFRCAKVEDVFFVNVRGVHSTGPRAADGRQWRTAVHALIGAEAARRKPIATVDLDGKRALFQIANPLDEIQKRHWRGEFFEQDELPTLASLVGSGKTIVEIGANVGNHLVFYGLFMAPKKIFPFEPNPESVALLRRNIALNGLEALVDDRGIGIGLGRASGRYGVVMPEHNNLGAARLTEGGDIEVRALDDVMGDEKIDFIKIDVEGMEFDVLDGAARVIAQNRPMIYIEIWKDHIAKFAEWCDAKAYRVIATAPYVNAVNALIGPA